MCVRECDCNCRSIRIFMKIHLNLLNLIQRQCKCLSPQSPMSGNGSRFHISYYWCFPLFILVFTKPKSYVYKVIDPNEKFDSEICLFDIFKSKMNGFNFDAVALSIKRFVFRFVMRSNFLFEIRLHSEPVNYIDEFICVWDCLPWMQYLDAWHE